MTKLNSTNVQQRSAISIGRKEEKGGILLRVTNFCLPRPNASARIKNIFSPNSQLPTQVNQKMALKGGTPFRPNVYA